ncbi:hypothetical protein PSTG_15598 [Puccinia striiformis f. sp. tritici PST-78]|uniref:Secreted protein n=1 Tax=Puccinia striiformis f. sp. tritici PST-78 TaxID=1165861 RepID=A0A0L0UVA5_9BASI|nr:hypothetical protein PSTG_15598 [Puccinia striiformis f. sp. tritici PST-78]
MVSFAYLFTLLSVLVALSRAEEASSAKPQEVEDKFFFGNGFNNYLNFGSGYNLFNSNSYFYNTWSTSYAYNNIFAYGCFPRTSIYTPGRFRRPMGGRLGARWALQDAHAQTHVIPQHANWSPTLGAHSSWSAGRLGSRSGPHRATDRRQGPIRRHVRLPVLRCHYAGAHAGASGQSAGEPGRERPGEEKKTKKERHMRSWRGVR